MPGITSILNIGKSALFASQSAIQVTGNNISNVNTEGYTRQAVVLQEAATIDYSPGQLGTGVNATEVIRYFDEFIEAQFNEKNAMSQRWSETYDFLVGAEALFNESLTSGMNEVLGQFFTDWQALSQSPDDYATREALVGNAHNLTNILHNVDADLATVQEQMDNFIESDVARVNELLEGIAELNVQIINHEVEGQNNPNTLYDQRANMVRELSGLIDVTVQDTGGPEDFTIHTQSGYTLVEGKEHYSLSYESPKVIEHLSSQSQFDGNISYNGLDEFEYTIEVVRGGEVSNASNAAMFRVSLDGGRTWIRNEDGSVRTFFARPEETKVHIGDLEIYFENMTEDLTAGDSFTIVPKNGLYWVENTSSMVNITPQIRMDGTDNDRRVVGGSLAAYFNFRDYYSGRYREKLDAFAESLTWEVNRLHAQGAGLNPMRSTLGTYSVQDTGLALGSDSSGLVWSDRLEEGNVMMYFYDTASGELASDSPANAYGPLDFDPTTPGIQNFDPTQHSMEDVRDAINNTWGQYVTATILNNQLSITADDGNSFAFGTDSAGLMAGLGINTFFDGSDAQSIEINADVTTDLDRVNAGHVNGGGELNPGDNNTALLIADLANADVKISTLFEVGSTQTLSEYYNTLVATVGQDTANAEYNHSYQKTLADDLFDRQEAIAGVNLDEEMSALIKFQHSYTAAAKLITTADEMLQTVLGMKA